MQSRLFHLPKVREFDAAGDVLSGGKLYFYLAGTSTPATTYQDNGLTTPHAHPVVADAAGVFPPIFLDYAVNYKVELKTSVDVLVSGYPVDNLTAAWTRSQLAPILWPQSATELAAGITITGNGYFYEYGDLRRYGAALDGLTNDYNAFDRACRSGHEVIHPGGTCRYDASLTVGATVSIRGAGNNAVFQPSAAAVAAGAALRLQGDRSRLFGVHFDCSLCDNNNGVVFEGDRCQADFTMSGYKAPNNGSTNIGGVRIEGVKCDIRVRLWDFEQNSAHTNNSFPQGVQIATGADDTTLWMQLNGGATGLFIGNNVLRPRIQHLEVRNYTDNGVYDVGAIDGYCDECILEPASIAAGGYEGWVASDNTGYGGGANFTIDSFTFYGPNYAGGALRMENYDKLVINSFNVFYTVAASAFASYPSVISLRAGATPNVTTGILHIKQAHIVSRSSTVFAFTTGVLLDLRIDDLDLSHYYCDLAQGREIFDQSGAPQSINIGRMKLRVRELVAPATPQFLWNLCDTRRGGAYTNYSQPSFIGPMDVFMVAGTEFRMPYFDQDNIATDGNDADNLGVQPRLRDILVSATGVGRARKFIYGTTAPTVGNWRRGDIVWNVNPVVGNPYFWICTTDSTPGPMVWTPSAVL